MISKISAFQCTLNSSLPEISNDMAPGTAPDASAIRYTREYLQRFDLEAAKAKSAAELIDAMKKA